jgi:hypothetical protein
MTTAQPYPSRWLTPRWRLASSCCAFAVVLLLLIQPLLCLVHCAMEARAMTHAAAHTAPSDPFLCHMSDAQSPHVLIVPAFWPGVLPVVVLLVTACSLLRRLMLVAPPHLIARLWAPPIPPPRLICAA